VVNSSKVCIRYGSTDTVYYDGLPLFLFFSFSEYCAVKNKIECFGYVLVVVSLSLAWITRILVSVGGCVENMFTADPLRAGTM